MLLVFFWRTHTLTSCIHHFSPSSVKLISSFFFVGVAQALQESFGSPNQENQTTTHTVSGQLWVDKYAPNSFTELLSDEQTNREVCEALPLMSICFTDVSYWHWFEFQKLFVASVGSFMVEAMGFLCFWISN